jgi:hypothetical protein
VSAARPVLPPDAAQAHRLAADAQRLQRYDHNAAALVPFLTTLAARIDAGTATPEDAARLVREADLLRRTLPADLPVYGDATRED